MIWQPTLGAWPSEEGVQFRVWAPAARTVEIILTDHPRSVHPLKRTDDGFFAGFVPSASAGSLYQYCINGEILYPDPASRFQPQGVHGPSQVIDPKLFSWSGSGWRSIPLKHLILYELHVGTFTPQGTFKSLSDRLPYIKDMGVTGIELMPVADFPGHHNWGYDGVSLFSPAHRYGKPDDLRSVINRAHQIGLAVILDVVYNHLGPDGNYLGNFSPFYFSNRHQTSWGSAVNLDGDQSVHVRAFFIENALHWIHDYHFDGLRFDATHAMVDESRRHFLSELSGRLRDTVRDRTVLLMAEDCRNLASIVKPENKEGWGMDAVWSDDFHHEVRRSLAGDHEGYFRDFSGSLQDLVATIRRGWFFCGQPSEHFEGPRGTDPDGIPLERFIFFIQNHDQVGNRAFGERLNHQIDPASYRAASVLLLSCPETPLLFMGQEWGAGSPFLYFTDHEGELGHRVTKGRRSEFKDFSNFSDPAARQRIPDPQDPETFNRSLLHWEELDSEKHSSLHRLYRALLQWRREELCPLDFTVEDFEVRALDDHALSLKYRNAGMAHALILLQWCGMGRHELPIDEVDHWDVALSSEDAEFCSDPHAIQFDGSRVTFQRPGAVILRPQK